MKRSSPSRGAIRPGASVTEIVSTYEAGGARACSILTEPNWFGGSLDDLVEARGATSLPLLRKDFLVDEYQLLVSPIVRGESKISNASLRGVRASARLRRRRRKEP